MIPIADLSDLGTVTVWVGMVICFALGFIAGTIR